MLADDMVAQMRRPEDKFLGRITTASAVLASQKFLLSPRILQLCKALKRHRIPGREWSNTFLPDRSTWIEWTEGEKLRQKAVWWAGETAGDGLIIHRVDREEVAISDFRFDFSAKKPVSLWPSEPGGLQDDDWAWDSINVSLCALALINAPRLAETRLNDFRRLNTARARKGRAPLVEYRDVLLIVDATARPGYSTDNRRGAVEREAPRLHHVRCHIRVKRARAELVSPHWRGNPHKGVLIKNRIVEMS